MSANKRVALGMSGGVDSSVSVEILKRAGYEVVGVTCVFHDDESSRIAVRDAARVCERMGIAHRAPDCTKLFEREVVKPFVSDYAHCLTPSPCIGCNVRVKFPSLISAADELGCDWVATGHYARIVQCDGRAGTEELQGTCDAQAGALQEDGLQGSELQERSSQESIAQKRFAVATALDARKDQSYMLSLLTQEQLARIVFPLGGMTKTEVRLIAADLGLEVADKPESQDVCFIDGDYRDFIHAHGVKDMPGPIVDTAGEVLGAHDGLSNFTVGQRKGIGVSGPEPYYVLEKRERDHALVVGFSEDARIGKVLAGPMNWQAIPALRRPCEAMVKLRYRSTPAACIIEPQGNGRVLVRLREDQPTTAPGQYAVFYKGSTVLGGGMIEEVSA